MRGVWRSGSRSEAIRLTEKAVIGPNAVQPLKYYSGKRGVAWRMQGPAIFGIHSSGGLNEAKREQGWGEGKKKDVERRSCVSSGGIRIRLQILGKTTSSIIDEGRVMEKKAQGGRLYRRRKKRRLFGAPFLGLEKTGGARKRIQWGGKEKENERSRFQSTGRDKAWQKGKRKKEQAKTPNLEKERAWRG